jgi:hypothetical protein
MLRLALVVVALPAVASAALPWLDGDWTRRVEGRGLARFVHHGVERAPESLQTEAWLANDRLRLGTWTNFPASDTRSHEFALVAAVRHGWSGGFEVELEVTHYHLRDARNGHPGHTAELALGVSRAAGPGRLAVAVLHDVKRQAELVQIAYGGEWALTGLGAFLRYRLEAGAKAARDVLPNLPGPAVGDSYAYAQAAVELPYRVAESWVVTAGASLSATRGQRPFWSPTAARSGAKVSFALGAAYEF